MKKLFVTAVLLAFATTARAETATPCANCCPPKATKSAKIQRVHTPQKKAAKPAPKPVAKAEDPKPCSTCNVTVTAPPTYQLDPVIINVVQVPEPKVIVINQTTVAPEKPQPSTKPDRYLRLGVGVLGFGFVPEKKVAWGWGPALQLQVFFRNDIEFTLAGATALGLDSAKWSPGHTRAWMSETGVTFWSGHVGFMLGAHLQQIGVKPSWERGMYVGAIPGLAFQWYPVHAVRLRIELKPFAGVAKYANDEKPEFAYGGTAGAFLSF